VEWPESRTTGAFVIGIVGDSPISEELVVVTRNKRVGNRPIVIKTLDPQAHSFNSHIIFISEEESGNVKRIARITEDQPTLIVAENNGLISKGACINFVVVGDHLKLEFGKNNIEKRNLKIASDLLSLGTIVD
jgi:hypothetical protein